MNNFKDFVLPIVGILLAITVLVGLGIAAYNFYMLSDRNMPNNKDKYVNHFIIGISMLAVGFVGVKIIEHFDKK